MSEGLKNMIDIRWFPEAIEDFDEIYVYLARELLIYAENLYDKIEEIIKNIQKFPKMGRIVPEYKNPLIREIIINKYRLIYGILDSKTIEILTVIYGSRELKM